MTGKLLTAQVLPAAACWLIVPIGINWVVGAIILGMVFIVFMATKNVIPTAFAGLLCVAIWLNWIPQVFMILLGIILAVILTSALIRLWRSRSRG